MGGRFKVGDQVRYQGVAWTIEKVHCAGVYRLSGEDVFADDVMEHLLKGSGQGASEVSARAFGAGCDARIGGKPCKPPHGLEESHVVQWRRGWAHVHREWGMDAKWLFKSLPGLPEPEGGVADVV